MIVIQFAQSLRIAANRKAHEDIADSKDIGDRSNSLLQLLTC